MGVVGEGEGVEDGVEDGVADNGISVGAIVGVYVSISCVGLGAGGTAAFGCLIKFSRKPPNKKRGTIAQIHLFLILKGVT